MNAKESGFTLIELVIVIVVLGILAVTALPKFIDLSAQAELAAVNGVAGAGSSAFAGNYGGYVAKNPNAVQVSGVVTLTAIANLIMVGGLPSVPTAYGFSPTSVACGTTAALAIPVTVTNAGFASTASATIVCTG